MTPYPPNTGRDSLRSKRSSSPLRYRARVKRHSLVHAGIAISTSLFFFYFTRRIICVFFKPSLETLPSRSLGNLSPESSQILILTLNCQPDKHISARSLLEQKKHESSNDTRLASCCLSNYGLHKRVWKSVNVIR